MAENSKIEWTTHTFNPWVGCEKVGPPCDNCYAESWAKRTGQPGLWQGQRRHTSEALWRQPFKWDRAAAKAGERHRVFSASLADWLDNKAPDEWRAQLAAIIEQTPHLDWLLLTKRIGNFAKHAPWCNGEIPGNVWLGITCGDQKEFDRDWPKLMHLRAAVRFISYEPALGPLTFSGDGDTCPDWIICGGESGPKARYMDPQWARNLRGECHAMNVAFFMKQMTGKAPIPTDLMVRQFPPGVAA